MLLHKKWVPELQAYDSKTIHALFKENSPHIESYPKPIVNHSKQAVLVKKWYANTPK